VVASILVSSFYCFQFFFRDCLLWVSSVASYTNLLELVLTRSKCGTELLNPQRLEDAALCEPRAQSQLLHVISPVGAWNPLLRFCKLLVQGSDGCGGWQYFLFLRG
jgi:hypothetical protein